MPQPTPLKTGAWDAEEDELLYYWQGKVGNKWSEVAKHIPGRTGQQCAQRWRHKVNPNIRRDKWTEDEDSHLMDLVKTFGIGKWAEIARHMEGRTDQQCMGRWRRHLDPAIRRDSWSPEEDQRLRALYQQYGTSWSRISKALKGRTSQQCRARWHQLDSGRSRRSGGSGSGGHGSAAGGRRGSSGKRRQPTARRRFDSSESDEDDEVDDALTESDADGEAEGEALGEAEDGSYDPAAPALVKGEPQQQCGAVYEQQPAFPRQHRYDVQADGAGGSCVPSSGEGYAQPDRDQDMAGGSGGEANADGVCEGADGVSIVGRATDSVLASARRRLAARKQQQAPLHQNGVLGSFALLSPPRRPPRMPATGVGVAGGCMSTPKKQGHAPGSPGAGIMSPSLLSPPGSARRLSVGGCYEGDEPGSSEAEPPGGWQQVVAAQGLDDEEAAGAETLLQMAAVFRHGSGDLEPPALRRSDFITGNTPTKRSPGRRPETRLSDELSPSPFKKARSFTGAGGAGDLLDGVPDFRRRLAAAAAADDERDAQLGAGADADGGGQAPGGDGSTARGVSGSGQRLTAKRSARRRASALPFRAAVLDGDGDDAMDDAVAESDSDGSIDGAGGPVGFELDVAAELEGAGVACHVGAAGAEAEASPDALVRPSNASTLTGVPGALMSPPAPAGRRGWADGEERTPGKAAMNLLASSNFDRLAAGCATPTNAHAAQQPSPATLALLQSPQASAMLEPFWTPYTGLSKEPLLRNTSETPDPGTAGRHKSAAVRGLFSPPSGVKREGSPSAAEQGAALAAAVAAAAAAAADAPDAAPDSQQDAADQAVAAAVAAAAAEALAGAAVAAACSRRTGGLEASAGVASSSHHRVVRRLDQHEAWGAATATAAGASSPKASNMLSPPKRARNPVPLFCESGPAASGNAAAGSSPRPLGVKLEFDGVAVSGRGGGGGRGYEPSRLNPASSARAPSGGAAALTGRSPRRPASWKVPPASALLMSPPGPGGGGGSAKERRQRLSVPQAVMEAAALVAASAAAAAAATAEQELQEQLPDGGSAGAQQLPSTPLHAPLLDGQQSTSATPTTPSVRAGTAPGSGTVASPSDCVTPQQRVRLAPPTAPLHRDCLLSVAASAAARLAAAAAEGDAPETVTSKGPTGAEQQPQRLAAQTAAADAQVAESSPMSASPAAHGRSPCAGPSPSWGPGMITMLQGLQRTPLVVRQREVGEEDSVADGGGAAAGGGSLQLQEEPQEGAEGAAHGSSGVGSMQEARVAGAGADGGLGQYTVAVSAARCATEAVLATPCSAPVAMPLATPATLQASQLSDATPLAGGGFRLTPPLAAGMPPTVLSFTPMQTAAAAAAGAPTPAPYSDTSSNKENAEHAPAAAATPAVGAAAVFDAAAAPMAAMSAAALPPAWLQGGSTLTMHYVPVKLQLQPGVAGAPMQAVLSAGAPKSVAAVAISQPEAACGGAQAHVLPIGEPCGSAEARSRLHALLEGL